MKLFKDRDSAGNALRDVLPLERMRLEHWNFVAVSKGGLAVIASVNKRLSLPVDLLFSASISAPNNTDCEIARVCETEEIVIHEALCHSFDIQVDYVYGEASRKHEEKILPDIYKYRKGRHFDSKQGETVLIVDEGSETGLKLMLAIKAILAQKPKAVYVAVPIVPQEILDAIEALVDEVFCIKEIDNFKETPCYYEKLEPVDDETIEMILKKDNG
ncbi:MAG: phosphoribosyltransferase family protein [Campylobacterota bacterium]|nr:phosphoribosyltransferase family protein [Campylobacterota bacterium]